MEEAAEGIFGCKMGDAVGDLVYGTWCLLCKKKRITRHAVEQSVADGSLPAKFTQWLQDIPVSEHSTESLSLCTSPDLFAKIPWNLPGLRLCAKPDAQINVTISAVSSAAFTKDPAAVRPSPADLSRLVQGEHAKAREASPPRDKAAKKKAASKKGYAEQRAPKPAPVAPKRDIGDYTWVQQDDELEITIYVGEGVSRRDVSIAFKTSVVQITSPKDLTLELHAPIAVEGCGWTLGSDEVVITLEKKKPGEQWPKLLRVESKP